MSKSFEDALKRKRAADRTKKSADRLNAAQKKGTLARMSQKDYAAQDAPAFGAPPGKLPTTLQYTVAEIAAAPPGSGHTMEAILLAKKLLEITAEQRIVTCIYCGYAYPTGTPTNRHKRLTDHIKVCPDHPMKKVVEALQGTLHSLEYVTSQEDKFKNIQLNGRTVRDERIAVARAVLKELDL